MSSTQLRREFADFLDELTIGQRDPDKWLKFVVEHYFDERLEEIRIGLVRMDINGTLEPERLRRWASELRSSQS